MTEEKNYAELLGKYIGYRNPPEKGKLYGKITSLEKVDGFWFVHVKGLHTPKYGKPISIPPEGTWLADQKEMFMLGVKYGSKIKP